jgi:para-aminobenzoate synthetase component 1
MYPFEIKTLVPKLVAFTTRFDYCSIHLSNGYATKHEIVAAFGSKKIITNLDELEIVANEWNFGYVAYDTKNQLEQLHSKNKNEHDLADECFFVPEFVITADEKGFQVFPAERKEEIISLIDKLVYSPKKNNPIQLAASTSKEEYLHVVNKLKQHIQQGDIYEINYCMNFFSNDVSISPEDLFLQLNTISEAPFASYTKLGEHMIISSSPERFIYKQKNQLITQPIKGTAARGKTKTEDDQNKFSLRNDKKEINENVMIVDVSRNDLSRIATKGSVQVTELFDVKTYKQVHQMVSTVRCELKPNNSIKSIFKATFPPASMTGAPKIKAMELIDEYENFRRGVYSGSIGFIEPNGNFDFNVVIRSIIYNQRTKHLSYAVGSAITAKCDAENEYNECLLKAEAMKKVLAGNA